MRKPEQPVTYPNHLETDRLVLRHWRTEDCEPFAHMCSDTEIMRYFPAMLSREESDALARRIQALIEKNGWGFWALQNKESSVFIGFVGLNRPDYPLPCQPCVEVGWRLEKSQWGKGYASEAATCALNFGFTELSLREIVSFTALENHRSRAVMQRLGMAYSGEFDHPEVPVHSPLRRHVLYKLKVGEFTHKHSLQAPQP